jgi:uncharacterized protein (TIGR03437 family)
MGGSSYLGTGGSGTSSCLSPLVFSYVSNREIELRHHACTEGYSQAETHIGGVRVNAFIPKGITPGNAVPLVVTVAGFESAPVTVAIK